MPKITAEQIPTISVAELAAMLHVAPKTLLNRRSSKKLQHLVPPMRKHGNVLVCVKSDFDAWLLSLPTSSSIPEPRGGQPRKNAEEAL